ncbi:MAG: hypothetical protein ACOYM3_14835 [Terrimicrobiaceae bacterium]
MKVFAVHSARLISRRISDGASEKSGGEAAPTPHQSGAATSNAQRDRGAIDVATALCCRVFVLLRTKLRSPELPVAQRVVKTQGGHAVGQLQRSRPEDVNSVVSKLVFNSFREQTYLHRNIYHQYKSVIIPFSKHQRDSNSGIRAANWHSVPPRA